MSFTFSTAEMVEDLGVVARAASKFLAAGSPHALTRCADDLRSAVANAVATEHKDFLWNTVTPILIAGSRHWKGTSGNVSEIDATISIDYKCEYLAESQRVLVREGVTVVVLRLNEATKTFHFDAGEGGWYEKSGHPPLHFQFYGAVSNDIPRLPVFIIHPLDVIVFTILELHQSKWREYVNEHVARSLLRRFPERQRARVRAILARWHDDLNDKSLSPLIIFQRRLTVPHAL